MESLQPKLASGLEQLALPANQAQLQQLVGFVSMLAKWNKVYNLTAIRNPEAMVNLHILDSLAIAPYVQGERIVDVGTGAGLPGIPLAIALPDRQFVLLDSNAKKTRFVQQAALELKLNNVTVCTQRVENYRPDKLFATVLTRAFASLAETVASSAHLVGQNGIMLAMKGQKPATELAQIGAFPSTSIIPITVPGITAERCLVKITLSAER